jgi:N-acetylmuramoyl-L-alanine amidase
MLFAVSASPKHRVFVMENPPRLVIDIKNTALNNGLSQPPADHPLFAKLRIVTKNADELKLVVDLKQPVRPEKFSLRSDNHDAHRLIIDLVGKTNAAKPPPPPDKKYGKTPATVASTGKAIIIAIDAGHGGNDPGAHGPNGTEEKIVTFAIAQKLAAFVNAQPGMRAVMVRQADNYMGLRERMHVARAAKADLFVSIHADAFEDTAVRGASVYTLSTSGASNEAARWLEKTENAADLVGGVSLSDKEDVLASVLLDLSQAATLEASHGVADSVLKSFQGVSLLHKDSVQKAGFIVLKSPDVPSILVETAFISNPLEERNLLSPRYQAQMAKAIFTGIRNFFKKTAPVNSHTAAL